MKIALYRENKKTPFKLCHDPDNVKITTNGIITLKDTGEKFKIVDEDCKTLIKNEEKYILYKVWVK